MKARTRSISGALMMLVIAPLFAGLLACMPEYVPLGNPEHARVDPNMTGLWYAPGKELLIGNLIFLQPWDKRTWLSVNISIELLEDLDPELYDPQEFDMSTYGGFMKVLSEASLDEDSVEVTVITYKAWLVRLAGETFFTWEWRGLPNDETREGTGVADPWYWLDLRIDETSEDRLVMRLIDPDFLPLKEAPNTKRAWEKVVRKHVDDQAMYMEDAAVFERVAVEHHETVAELMLYAFVRDTR